MQLLEVGGLNPPTTPKKDMVSTNTKIQLLNTALLDVASYRKHNPSQCVVFNSTGC